MLKRTQIAIQILREALSDFKAKLNRAQKEKAEILKEVDQKESAQKIINLKEKLEDSYR